MTKPSRSAEVPTVACCDDILLSKTQLHRSRPLLDVRVSSAGNRTSDAKYSIISGRWYKGD